MNQKAFWSHVLCGAGAVLLLVLVILQGARLNDLQETVSDLSHQANQAEARLNEQMQTVSADIQRKLDAQTSLFSSLETTLGYQNDMLTLDLRAIPKERFAGETAKVLLADGSAADLVWSDSGAAYEGRLVCPIQEAISPTLILTSGQDKRQEALTPLYVADVLALKGETQWQEDNTLLLTLAPSEQLTAQLLDGCMAEATVLTEAGDAVGTFPGLPVAAPEDKTPGAVCYTFDLRALWAAEDGVQYHIGITLTTAQDLTLESESAAGFQAGTSSSMTGHGTCDFRPIFP